MSGVTDDLIFGPRGGEGAAVVSGPGTDANRKVWWDAESAGQKGHNTVALLHR